MHARAEHVWVTDVQVWGDVPHPGLLVEWRKAVDGAWEGLVVAVEAYSGGWQVRQRWVAAAAIKPPEPAIPPRPAI